MKRVRAFGILATAAVLCHATTAGAQRVSGVVRDSATGGPLRDAIVSLWDGHTSLGDTRTDSAGSFSIPDDPRARSLLVRLIGYMPVQIALGSAAPGEGRRVDAMLTRTRPITHLAPVNVTGTPECRVDPAGRAGEALWQRAREVYFGPTGARDPRPVEARVIRYTFVTDSGPGRTVMTPPEPRGSIRSSNQVDLAVVAHEQRLHGPSPLTPSRPVDDVLARGYLVRNQSAPWPLVPEPDAVFDASFADVHCLTAVPPAEAPRGQVGVRFTTKVARRTDVTDIDGVLWMDAEPLALRSLEFTYVGGQIPHFIAVVTVGGRLVSVPFAGWMTFATAPNGVPVVDAWVQHSTPWACLQCKPWVNTNGAVLMSARWDDGTTLVPRRPQIDGIVVDRATGAAVPGARAEVPRVWKIPASMGLPGFGLGCCGPLDAFSVTADPAGRFSFAVPFVNRYAITARDTTYAAFGVVRAPKAPIILEADTTNTAGMKRPAVIALDPAIEVARGACKKNVFGPGPSVLLMRVSPVHPDAAQGPTSTLVPVSNQWRVRHVATEQQVTFYTAADHVAICGIPAGAVTVHASDGKGQTGQAFVRISGNAVIDTATIRVDRKR